MNSPKCHLNRLGSDPEFLFVSPADFGFVIQPAQTILQSPKNLSTASFIGHDSRPIIGELRPSPFRNSKQHLFELAYALDKTQVYLDEKYPQTQMLAYPHLHGESLGGHIHVSFFVEDPLLAELSSNGYALDSNGNPVTKIPGMPPVSLHKMPKLYEKFQSELNTGTLFTAPRWGRIMGWLLSPFEQWIQPWVSRELRNTHYGGDTPDFVRLGVSKEPPVQKDSAEWRRNSVYVHWEYRVPSTWLHHPCLAYAYLGLAKLTMLNFRLVSELYVLESDPDVVNDHTMGNFHNYSQLNLAKNGLFEASLLKRLAEVFRLKPVITKDLIPLEKAIEQCGRQREKWFRSPTPIDMTAWRKLLV